MAIAGFVWMPILLEWILYSYQLPFWVPHRLGLVMLIFELAQKAYLIYNHTTKKLRLLTYNYNPTPSESSITLLNSFSGKRVVFWLTKKGTWVTPTVKTSKSNHSATLTLNSAMTSQSNYKFQIFSQDSVIYKETCSPNLLDFDSMQYHKIMIQEKLNGSYIL